jgi:hypothetical protein
MKAKTKPPVRVRYKGTVYIRKAFVGFEDDPEIEDAVEQLGKIRELIKGTLGLIRDRKYEEAEKLLDEQIQDLKQAKEDIMKELSKKNKR